MSTLSILIAAIVILAIVGTAYLFRSELLDDRKTTEENVQTNQSIETENKAVETNNSVSDVEIKKVQGLKLTPAREETTSLDDKEQPTTTTSTIDTSASSSGAEEIEIITTTVVEKDKKEQADTKEVVTTLAEKAGNVDTIDMVEVEKVEKIEAVEKTVREKVKSEISVSDTKDKKPIVNEIEGEIFASEKQQTQDTTKTIIDNSVEEVEVIEAKKEETEQIVIEENKPKEDLSDSEIIDSDQSDSIKEAIQQQIKESKQILKLLVDHEDH